MGVYGMPPFYTGAGTREGTRGAGGSPAPRSVPPAIPGAGAAHPTDTRLDSQLLVARDGSLAEATHLAAQQQGVGPRPRRARHVHFVPVPAVTDDLRPVPLVPVALEGQVLLRVGAAVEPAEGAVGEHFP